MHKMTFSLRQGTLLGVPLISKEFHCMNTVYFKENLSEEWVLCAKYYGKLYVKI
jgi:hypothetical protein